MSAGCGPLASIPRSAAAAIAGAMCSMSSSPNRPCSPACGLRPHTAIRGRSRKRRSVASVSSITSSTRGARVRSIASRNEQCVLTWVTAIDPPPSSAAVSIIVTFAAPHRAAISSVCPTKPGSESCVASLFIGIVTTPATRPASASSVARRT